MVVVMISLRSGCARKADRIAVESDSVPHDVKMISDSCAAPSSACDEPCQGLGNPGQIGAGRGPHPAEAQRAVGTHDVHPVKEQHHDLGAAGKQEAQRKWDAGSGQYQYSLKSGTQDSIRNHMVRKIMDCA